MPLYSWQCTECEAGVEVLRSFKEYEQEPDDAEINQEGIVGCKGDSTVRHKWKRLIGGDIKAYRGAGWRGAKGYW